MHSHRAEHRGIISCAAVSVTSDGAVHQQTGATILPTREEETRRCVEGVFRVFHVSEVLSV